MNIQPLDGFGGRLFTERVLQGLTREELAVKSRLSIKSLTRYEDGAHKPSLPLLYALCKALKVKSSSLLGF